jgi:hypothetical protein
MARNEDGPRPSTEQVCNAAILAISDGQARNGTYDKWWSKLDPASRKHVEKVTDAADRRRGAK